MLISPIFFFSITPRHTLAIIEHLAHFADHPARRDTPDWHRARKLYAYANANAIHWTDLSETARHLAREIINPRAYYALFPPKKKLGRQPRPTPARILGNPHRRTLGVPPCRCYAVVNARHDKTKCSG